MNSPFEELLSYIGLDAGDRTRLADLHDKLAPHFVWVAEAFYAAVWKHPRAAAVLRGPEQVARLRVTLIDWMASGLRGPYDEAFYEKRSRIGRRHVEIGLAQEYMFTAMNVVRSTYHDRIATLYALEEASAVTRSVNKLLDLELAIMLRHYQLDSEVRVIAHERRMQADRISAMQTMTAGLAHEVRNPLNAAKLQLELLERRLRREHDDPRLIEPSELAQQEIQRLTDLLNSFLAFARPPDLHVEERDIVEIVRHICDLERVSAEQRGARLAALIAPEVVRARVDAGKLSQIVLNLVRNAIEAVTAKGNVAVEITSSDDAFTVTVQDDGAGIPLDVQARIYEPFFSTKEGGTGLGMSIAHSLVTLHGGMIHLVSSSQGTRFDVTIPRRP